MPLKYEVKKRCHQEQRTLVPAIAGLMFAKGTLEELKEYVSRSQFTVYLRKSTFSNKENYLTVPTKAMDDFIAVTVDHEAHISYFRPEEIKLQTGDKIRVKGGIYDGKEGVIMRIKGKRNKHLVVQIPGLLAAAVEMTPDLIELTDKEKRSLDVARDDIKEKPSKNVDADKKYLFDTAHRLLFEITNKYKEDQEYYLLMGELKRCRARLVTFKGFTPATEAELALPMFMAAVITGEDISGARARLEKATDRLKPSSKLKAKCAEILSVLSGDRYLAAAESPARYLSPDRTAGSRDDKKQ